MRRRKDFRLSAEERIDAREALLILEGSGVSLAEAARRAVGRAGAVEGVAYSEGVRRFLRDRRERGLRSTTLRWYEDTLFAAEDALGAFRLDQVERELLERYLRGAGARAARFRALRALFRWARHESPPLVGVDPTEGMRVDVARRDREPQILTPGEAEELMAKPSPYRATWALLLFAGIRPSETNDEAKEPLLWRHVDLEARTIRVPPGVAKTRRSRILEGLPGRVWQVLEQEAGAAGDPVCPHGYLQAIAAAQRRLGYRDRKGAALKPWGRDCTRHSFATYHLALTSDPGKTALLLGHEGNPAMLYRHYRGLATKAEARRWFALREK